MNTLMENKRYMVSPDLESFIKTYGVIKGKHFQLGIHLTGLTDIFLDDLLHWMENKINDKQILICNGKRCVNCFPKDWDWNLRTCVIAMDYCENLGANNESTNRIYKSE